MVILLAEGLFLIVFILFSPSSSLPAELDCRQCHQAKELQASVHAPLDCSLCHQKTTRFPHLKGTGQAVCSQCHQESYNDYQDSVHGRSRAGGELDAAACQDCHGGHNIFKKEDSRSPVYHLNLPQTCARCHADAKLASRHGLGEGKEYQLFMDSIHGRAITKSGLLVAANCSDCHGTHRIYPPGDSRSSVNRVNIPATCGKCHAGITPIYRESIHGQGLTEGVIDVPVCTDCHTAHQIVRITGESWKLGIIQECGTCHQSLLTTYRDTYHGKVTSLGYVRVARCSDCHGAHDIRPVSDPQSRISPARVVSTCRRCHPKANANFARYYPHADYKNKDLYPSLYYTYFFMTALLVGVFGFFGLHLALWLGRDGWEWLRRK